MEPWSHGAITPQPCRYHAHRHGNNRGGSTSPRRCRKCPEHLRLRHDRGAVSDAPTVYQVKAWKLQTQSVIHFGIVLVTVLPAMYLSGWFALGNAMDYLQVLGIFLMVGAALWLLFYLIFGVLQPRFSFKQVSS